MNINKNQMFLFVDPITQLIPSSTNSRAILMLPRTTIQYEQPPKINHQTPPEHDLIKQIVSTEQSILILTVIFQRLNSSL